MTDAFRGLYRTIDGAYVTNSTMAFHVPEADYRAFGYVTDKFWRPALERELQRGKGSGRRGGNPKSRGTLNLCKPARLRRTTAAVQAI